MGNKRTHIVIPEELAGEIDETVGKRRRSNFLVEAARRELRRLRMLRALDLARGAWRDEDHPELRKGSEQWVRQLRKSEARRFRRVTSSKR
jgi:hypothetical protein